MKAEFMLNNATLLLQLKNLNQTSEINICNTPVSAILASYRNVSYSFGTSCVIIQDIQLYDKECGLIQAINRASEGTMDEQHEISSGSGSLIGFDFFTSHKENIDDN